MPLGCVCPREGQSVPSRLALAGGWPSCCLEMVVAALGAKGSALAWRCREQLLVRGVTRLFVLNPVERTVVDLLEQDPPLGNGGKTASWFLCAQPG